MAAPTKRKSEEVSRSVAVDPSELAATAEEISCIVCYEQMRPPAYQCPEGHLMCENCIPRVESQFAARCPICRERLPSKRIRCRAFDLVARALVYDCPYKGCPARLHLPNIDEHKKTCGFKPFLCPWNLDGNWMCQHFAGSAVELYEHCCRHGRKDRIVVLKEDDGVAHSGSTAVATGSVVAWDTDVVFRALSATFVVHFTELVEDDADAGHSDDTREEDDESGVVNRQHIYHIAARAARDPSTTCKFLYRLCVHRDRSRLVWEGEMPSMHLSEDDLRANGEGLFLTRRQVRRLQGPLQPRDDADPQGHDPKGGQPNPRRKCSDIGTAGASSAAAPGAAGDGQQASGQGGCAVDRGVGVSIPSTEGEDGLQTLPVSKQLQYTITIEIIE